MIACRARTRSIGTHCVISILAVRHGGEPVYDDDLVRDSGEQFVLAVKAAVWPVGSVGRVVRLLGLHLDDPGADEGRDLVCGKTLVRRQTGRDAEDGDDLVGTECAYCQREQDRGVDTAGECDATVLCGRGGETAEPASPDLAIRRTTLSDELGVDLTPEQVADVVIGRMAARYADALPLMPGADGVVRRLATRWPLGLASSSPRRLIDTVLDAAGWGALGFARRRRPAWW